MTLGGIASNEHIYFITGRVRRGLVVRELGVGGLVVSELGGGVWQRESAWFGDCSGQSTKSFPLSPLILIAHGEERFDAGGGMWVSTRGAVRGSAEGNGFFETASSKLRNLRWFTREPGPSSHSLEGFEVVGT